MEINADKYKVCENQPSAHTTSDISFAERFSKVGSAQPNCVIAEKEVSWTAEPILLAKCFLLGGITVNSEC